MLLGVEYGSYKGKTILTLYQNIMKYDIEFKKEILFMSKNSDYLGHWTRTIKYLILVQNGWIPYWN
tara:strand:+ start:311 stop:508 length:198 start_codon:yes stop_codon:yes gene_type:complete